MASLFQKLGNMKARALIVIVLVVVVIAGIMVWTAIRARSPDIIDTGTVNTKRIGQGVENLPGTGEASPVYDPLQIEENKKKADAALQGSTSAVPTLVNQGGDQYGRNGFDMNGTGRCGDECYNEKGFDENGFDRNGFNAAGFDRNGFDKDGFNKDGFDRNGFDKNGFDKNGLDRFGYDKDGYDKTGCNRQGFNREGKACKEILGADCFNKQGLDANGCNRDGNGPDGKGCYNKDGFNLAGHNKCGFDKEGYSKEGLDANGCDHLGKDKNGKACYDLNGFNAQGRDRFGMDKKGFGPDGLDKNGFDKNGLDKDGFDKEGFDTNGCNREGKNHAGKACYDAKGYNEAGLDKQGYDKNGYDKNGLDKQGFDKDGFDKDGFSRTGCNRQGLNREGKPCQSGTNEISGDLLSNLVPGVNAGSANLDATQAAAADYQRLLAEQANLDAQRNAELTAEQQAQALADQQARLQAYEAMMNTQAQAILQSWAPPTQMYVKGKAPVAVAQTPTAPATVNGLLPYGQGPIIQKAGDMLYAVIETSINSDEPGPVLARIVSEGELQGAKIMGTFQRQDQKVFVRFNVLSVDHIPQSIAIDAVAVDPETARTSLASDVDNHLFKKYATMLAASFLQGMGEAVETSLGTPQLESNGSATIASQVPATSRDQVIVGLGKVGQTVGQELESQDIQPTVTLDSGTGVGLLLMSDLRIEQPPPSTMAPPLRAAAPLAPGEKPPVVVPTTPAAGAPGTTPATTQQGLPGSLVQDNSLTSGIGKPFSGL